MKSNIFAYLLLGYLPMHAQQQQDSSHNATIPVPLEESEIPQAPVAALPTTARTFIPHSLEVSDFTPPVPVVRKPLPSVRIDSAVTVPTKNSRTLTILRGEASTLPDIPPPPVIEPVDPYELTTEDHARQLWHHRHNFNLGATVYDHKISQVQWTDPETHEFYQAICGFDIGLLAGVGGFVHEDEDYSFFLMHSNISTVVISRMAQNHVYQIPEIPAGEVRITRGNPDDAEAIKPLTVLKELIDAEKTRLLTYQAARAISFRDSAAWHAAHPPIPKDETFLIRPHRGSRYLANPQPEKQRAAR